MQSPVGARDHDAPPVLRGAVQLLQNDFWSQYNHAINVYNNDLGPVIDAAAKDNSVIIFEAYAEWCGFCQRIAPMFDASAKHFNQAGGLILAKGQCANNNLQLCDDLGVFGFPSFYYGTADDFRDLRGANSPNEINDLRSMNSAEQMV